MRLVYQSKPTTTEQQDAQFVNVVSLLTRAELRNMTHGCVRGNAKTDVMRAWVARMIASGRYLVVT